VRFFRAPLHLEPSRDISTARLIPLPQVPLPSLLRCHRPATNHRPLQVTARCRPPLSCRPITAHSRTTLRRRATSSPGMRCAQLKLASTFFLSRPLCTARSVSTRAAATRSRDAPCRPFTHSCQTIARTSQASSLNPSLAIQLHLTPPRPPCAPYPSRSPDTPTPSQAFTPQIRRSPTNQGVTSLNAYTFAHRRRRRTAHCRRSR
jgi:hypothetical protein